MNSVSSIRMIIFDCNCQKLQNGVAVFYGKKWDLKLLVYRLVDRDMYRVLLFLTLGSMAGFSFFSGKLFFLVRRLKARLFAAVYGVLLVLFDNDVLVFLSRAKKCSKIYPLYGQARDLRYLIDGSQIVQGIAWKLWIFVMLYCIYSG